MRIHDRKDAFFTNKNLKMRVVNLSSVGGFIDVFLTFSMLLGSFLLLLLCFARIIPHFYKAASVTS